MGGIKAEIFYNDSHQNLTSVGSTELQVGMSAPAG